MIRSKPSNEVYRKNWEKVFNTPVQKWQREMKKKTKKKAKKR